MERGGRPCRQGEGETCGVAVETAMDSVLVIELLKGHAPPWPAWRTTPTL